MHFRWDRQFQKVVIGPTRNHVNIASPGGRSFKMCAVRIDNVLLIWNSITGTRRSGGVINWGRTVIINNAERLKLIHQVID
jgi:hypothetical protein